MFRKQRQRTREWTCCLCCSSPRTACAAWAPALTCPCTGSGTDRALCWSLLCAKVSRCLHRGWAELCTGRLILSLPHGPCPVSRGPVRQARYHGRGDVAKRSEFDARKRALAEAREARLHKDDPKVASGGRAFPHNPLLQARPFLTPLRFV